MKILFVILAISSICITGCQDKPKIGALVAIQTTSLPAGHPPIADGQQMPKGDPHAGMKAVEVPASVPTQKATVVQTIDAGIYTYIEAKGEDGKTVWMALPKTSVTKDTKIEYPANVPPIKNFTSKTLKRSFESIYFVHGIKIVK
ncbi:hypothetical protein [Trichlorobacter lovleyi]|uniref:hypothetical protein n=1 Tax=Trichlorobacter lovleyi TaxID=313985 RepID=UPI0023F2148E|nr:hypothetical protein [Trichlorobacter lovleyi]